MKYYEKMYYYGKYTLYALYIITYLGLWDKAPIYLDQVDYFLKLLIAVLLVLFFNPIFGVKTFTTFHRNIAFSAGFFLLTTITLSGVKNLFVDTYHKINNRIKNGIVE